MRKTLLLGSAIALVLIAADVNLYRSLPVGVSINYVSAQEALPDFSATTTLRAADSALWNPAITPLGTDSEMSTDAQEAQAERARVAQRTAAAKATVPSAAAPQRIIIPSISLDTTVISVGVNEKGEMDVPDGSTNLVGWYKAGPKPGQMGSAVLDAHVFAAFENLRYAKVGDDIIIETVKGERLRFRIDESLVFELSELTPRMLFGRDDARRLTLITCAGTPVGDTYSHRLVVYAKFVEVL